MKTIVIFLACCLLAGCATSPVSYVTAEPVSPTNLLVGYQKFSSNTEGARRVIVVRDSGMLGSAIPAKLSINGIDVAKLWSSQRIEFFLQPDIYIFGVVPSPKLGGALVETTVDIKSGRSYALRISLPGNGPFSLQQSTQLE